LGKIEISPWMHVVAQLFAADDVDPFDLFELAPGVAGGRSRIKVGAT